MARVAVWHKDDVRLVDVDHMDSQQVVEWAYFLYAYAPGWVIDAMIGDLSDKRAEELVGRLRAYAAAPQ